MSRLQPGERLVWMSKLGVSVIVQRTDAGQTWTLEKRSIGGITEYLVPFGTEQEAFCTARGLCEIIRDTEAMEVAR